MYFRKCDNGAVCSVTLRLTTIYERNSHLSYGQVYRASKDIDRAVGFFKNSISFL